jgi:hypothetical protein
MKSLLLIIAGLLAGCTAWPPDGEGGMAEARLQSYQQEALPEELQQQLAALEQQMQAAVEAGSAACLPGQWLQVQRQLVRSQRDLYAGMLADGQESLQGAQLALAHLHSAQQLQQQECFARTPELLAGHSQSPTPTH